MKIVNIILTSQNGGAEQVFLDYCKILKEKLNHQVFAIVKKDAPYANKLDELDIESVKIENKFGDYDFSAVKKIAEILQKFDADAVISHIGRSHCLVKKAIKKIKHKKILNVAINHSNNVKRSIGADLILSVNKEIFYKTIDKGQDESKSFAISNATNTEIITRKNAINFDKKTITLGMMSRFDRTKGYKEILRSLRILNDNSDKKFILKIAGDGYFKKEIKKHIAKLKLEKNVEFLGWIKDKKEFFNGLDIFILPSIEETFGLVILEAMKHQTPIISSNASGPKEILRDKKDAILVELNPLKNYEEKLAQSILDLIKNEKLANEMIKNSAARLQEKFSFQNLESNLKEIFGKA